MVSAPIATPPASHCLFMSILPVSAPSAAIVVPAPRRPAPALPSLKRGYRQKPSSAISTTRCSRALISAAAPIATAIIPSRAVTSTGPSPRTAAMNR